MFVQIMLFGGREFRPKINWNNIWSMLPVEPSRYTPLSTAEYLFHKGFAFKNRQVFFFRMTGFWDFSLRKYI